MIAHLRGRFLPDESPRDGWVRDGRLTFERPPLGTPTETLLQSGWIIPGFVDAHCHVGLAPEGPLTDHRTLERQALEDRNSGALLLRDAGSPADTAWMAERADLPRLVRAGRHIARTRRYIRDFAAEVEPDELIAQVEAQARLSDGWVKIVVDWIDRDEGDLAPTFPLPVLAAAVERAHALGVRVAVHAFGEQSLRESVLAGVDSVEHATGMSPDVITQMRERGTVIVPTLINIDQFHAIAARAEERFPRYASHMRRLHESSRRHLRTAWEAGVPIFVGTDAGGTIPHGQVRSEIAALVGAGLPLEYVLAQASWGGREWLGVPGLSEGASADLLAFDKDPRSDLTVMFRPVVSMLRGSIF